ncbi:MAG: trigger factor [Synergistales bacterium]|nr:trigger factor [Synergistales bacterium]MDY6401173.1 trigger factor [Synergistales bacterium]MDY6404766.1 trigger factor [Synergistales bacterium]MDY6409972.1 trigger factor [Synergistales bacterium]MDY6414524.1 trigger factor [Synergistales bacterium]
MKTELLGQEKNIVKIKLDIEAAEFIKALNKTLNELSQQVRVPGFRKGKTPRNILEMRFGKEAIYNEALEKIVPEQIRQIVEDYDLDVIETPTLDVKEKIVEGQPVVCELTFEVRPEIELPEIENLEIEKEVHEVSDDDVNQLEKRIKLSMAEVKPAERAVQDGDIVNVELTIRVLNPDGSEAEEQPKREPSKEAIDLADQTIRQQVREALIGKNKGDEVHAEFDVEEKHYDREFAGKHLAYKMIIENISEYVMPEINEEFYKEVFGPDTDIKDYDAFRARLRDDIEKETKETAQSDLEDRAVELVAKNSKLELPESFVNRQIGVLRKDDEKWADNNNVSLTQAYALDTEEGKKGYEKILRDRAETNVRDVLVMDEVAKKFDVHLEQADLEAEFERIASNLKVSKGYVAKKIYEEEEAFDKLRSRLRWEKIIEVLLSHMKIKEVSELSEPEAQPEQENHDGE